MEDETYREKTGDELLWELVDYAKRMWAVCGERAMDCEPVQKNVSYWKGHCSAYQDMLAVCEKYANRKWRGYGAATGYEKVVDEVTGEAKYVKVK